MLSWGMDERVYETSGRVSYGLTLQFPVDPSANEHTAVFLKNLQDFEAGIKEHARAHSEGWFGKAKISAEVVHDLWTPIAEVPKE